MDISVVVPTYNRAQLLASLLDSWRAVAETTACRWELIVSDDGSEDETLRLLSGAKGLPLRTIRNAHKGAANARNVAIRSAVGGRIIITGDDIFPQPDFINRHRKLGEQLGDDVAILGHIEWHEEVRQNYLMHHITEVGNEQFSFNRLPSNGYTDFRHFYTSNISISRRMLLADGMLFDPAFYKVNFEDTELGYRLAARGLKIFYAPEIKGYHLHPYDVTSFCRRQYTAGEMAVVLEEKHPELGRQFGLLRLARQYECFKSRHHWTSEQAMSGASAVGQVQAYAQEYEKLLASQRVAAGEAQLLKTQLSSIYERLFRLELERGYLEERFPESNGNALGFLLSRHFGADFVLAAERRFRKVRWFTRRPIGLPPEQKAGAVVSAGPVLRETLLADSLAITDQASRASGVRPSALRARGRAVAMWTRIALRAFESRVHLRNRWLRWRAWLRTVRVPARPTGLTLLGVLEEGGCPLPASQRQAYAESLGEQVTFMARGSHELGERQSHPAAATRGVEYVYAPDDAAAALTPEELRNAALCLARMPVDALLVSRCLATLPEVGVSHWTSQLIFSRAKGRDWLLRPGTKGLLKVVTIPGALPGISRRRLTELLGRQDLLVDESAGLVWLGNRRRGVTPVRSVAENVLDTRSKTKPVIFVWPIFLAVGGVERNMVEVMRQLSHLYDFVVISMERLTETQGSLHHQVRAVTPHIYDLSQIASRRSYLDVLRELKESYEPDGVWICNGCNWLADNATGIRRLFADMPIIDQQVYDVREGWIRRYGEPGILSFDRFIAINKRIEKAFVSGIGIPQDRIDQIYHAVDMVRVEAALHGGGARSDLCLRYDMPAGEKIFLFVGRLTHQKRPDLLIEVVRRLRDKGDQSSFVMIGDGELRGEIEGQVSRYGLGGVVSIPFCENPLELMVHADAIVFLSEFEGLPIAMLEALAVGVPAFCTDVGDIRPVLDEYGAGMVVPVANDAHVYAQAFSDFVESLPEYKVNAEKNASAVRARFGGPAVAEHYRESFQRAMDAYAVSGQGVAGAG